MEHPVSAPVASLSAAPQAELAMNVLFNGVRYYVTEIGGGPIDGGSVGGAPLRLHGFEVVNKHTGHGAFIDGAVAEKMRTSFHAFVVQHGGQVSAEQFEDFISDYDALLMQRVVYH